MIFTREWRPEGKLEHLQENQTRLLDMYKKISEAVKPLHLSEIKERTLCSHTAIIGLKSGRLFRFGYDHCKDYTSKHPESRDTFRGFLQ